MIEVDWTAPALLYRLAHGGGRRQMLAKAVGLTAKHKPSVIDTTAGLGRDALVLASLGCQVVMLERHPQIFEALIRAFERVRGHDMLSSVTRHMTLIQADAIEWLQAVPQDYRDYKVIYLDPMFPRRRKSALVKKDMQQMQQMLGQDDDAARLLQTALTIGGKRVVLKRPSKADPLSDRKPDIIFTGQSSCFEVYLNTIKDGWSMGQECV